MLLCIIRRRSQRKEAGETNETTRVEGRIAFGIFRVISAFCGTVVAQNAEMTRKSASSENSRHVRLFVAVRRRIGLFSSFTSHLLSPNPRDIPTSGPSRGQGHACPTGSQLIASVTRPAYIRRGGSHGGGGGAGSTHQTVGSKRPNPSTMH